MKNIFNIDNFVKDFNLKCSKTQIKTFEKGEIITTYLVNRNLLCILIDGSADLVRYDLNGNRNIIDHFVNNDIFGEILYHINTNNELFVIAKKKCEVLFFNYDYFFKKCKSNCKFHDTLINNFPNLILNKIINLNIHTELLAKRTIREKLISYFSILSSQKLSKSFELPYSLTDLADYLNIDRSAMMRELKSLKDEGFIRKIGNSITLLYK